MVINLKDIRLAGKSEQDFDFDFNPTSEVCDIPNVQATLPIKVSCTVFLTGNRQAYVEGEIYLTLTGECTTCQTPTTKDYVFSFEQDFSQDNEYGYIIKRDAIDLTTLVMDELALQMPLNFVCGEDCKGIGKMEF